MAFKRGNIPETNDRDENTIILFSTFEVSVRRPNNINF